MSDGECAGACADDLGGGFWPLGFHFFGLRGAGFQCLSAMADEVQHIPIGASHPISERIEPVVPETAAHQNIEASNITDITLEG